MLLLLSLIASAPKHLGRVTKSRSERHVARVVELLAVQRVDADERALLRRVLDARLDQLRVLEDAEEPQPRHLAELLQDRVQAVLVVGVRDVAEEDGARGRGGRDGLGALDVEDDGAVVVGGDGDDAAVQALHGGLAVGLALELHEAVALGAAGVDVDHDAGGDERAEGAEPREEQIVVDAHRQVRDVDVREGLEVLLLLVRIRRRC